MMELVDMRGLKPRPFWVLVQVQVRVHILQLPRRILKYMPVARRFFRSDAPLHSHLWNRKTLLVFLILMFTPVLSYLIEIFQSFTHLEVFVTINSHYLLSFTSTLNVGTLLTQASHLFFLYLSIGALLLFVVLVT